MTKTAMMKTGAATVILALSFCILPSGTSHKARSAFQICDSVGVYASAESMEVYISTGGYLNDDFDTSRIVWGTTPDSDSIRIAFKLQGQRYPEEDKIWYLKKTAGSITAFMVFVADTLYNWDPNDYYKSTTLAKSERMPLPPSYLKLDTVFIHKPSNVNIELHWGWVADSVFYSIFADSTE